MSKFQNLVTYNTFYPLIPREPKYVGRVKEFGRIERRHSSFYIGLYGQAWVDFMGNCWELVMELMKLNPNKRKYYQQGQRAMKLILSAF